MAQLAEQSLPIPEACSSNPVIDEFLHRTFIYLLATLLNRQKRKRGGEWPIFVKNIGKLLNTLKRPYYMLFQLSKGEGWGEKSRFSPNHLVDVIKHFWR